MAEGGRDLSRHQQGIVRRYYEHIDTIALQKLSEIVSDLYLAEGAAATRLWNSARAALGKLVPADDPRVVKVLSVRSVTGLARLVNELSAGARATGRDEPPSAIDLTVGETAVAQARHEAPVVPGPPPVHVQDSAQVARPAESPPTPDQLKHAMKAFRKRLKLTKLDDESRLGRRAMTGGRHSAVVAIMPPREYSQAVWDELVRQGKLKNSGSGFYELAE
jgi:hypothetical protein